MKKLVSIMLCFILLASAVTFSVSADEPLNLVEEVFRKYGVSAIYATENVSTAPELDGVISEDEYTYSRSYTNLTSETRQYEDYRANNNFGVNCHPNNKVVIKEFVAVDEENIYLAFEFGQDLSDFMLRINPTQAAAYGPSAAHNTLSINFDLPESVDLDTTPQIIFANDLTDPEYIGDADGKNKFSMLYDKDNITTPEEETDDLDGIAQRNWTDESKETVANITAEFRFSKAALLRATGDQELNYFGYMAKGKRTEAGANCAEGGDVTLQNRLNSLDMIEDGYMKSYELWPNASTVAQTYYSTWGRLLRFIAFYEDPLAVPEQSSSESEPTTAEPTTAEGTTAEPTTAEATTAKPSATKPTVNTDATTAAATTAATTAAKEGGCKKSVALSALAIVPVLGLGVAVVAKKKED